MAKTDFSLNHPLAVSIWAKSLGIVAFRKTFIGKFSGPGESNIIQTINDFKSQSGAKITFGLNGQLLGDGIAGDATLEGNEDLHRLPPRRHLSLVDDLHECERISQRQWDAHRHRKPHHHG